MKSLSGSGSRGMMVDAMSAYGVDSFVGRVACTVQGSTDTTFYILAVYFGSVGVRKTRYAVGYALLADVIGAISAITVSYFFFKYFLFAELHYLCRVCGNGFVSRYNRVNRGFGLRSCALLVFYKIKEIKLWL